MSGNEKQEDNSWTQFSQDASMHGLRFVFDKSSHTSQRCIWGLLMIFSMVFLVFTCESVVRAFAEKQLSTSVKVKITNSMKFPTITICNQNTLKKSAIQSLFALNGDDFMALFNSLMVDLMSDEEIPEDKYNWSDPFVQIFNGVMPREDSLAGSALMYFTLDDIFVKCVYKQKRRNCSDLFTWTISSTGACFRFNPNGTEFTQSAGLVGGLSIVLDTKLEDYYPGPFSDSPGFSLSFHESFEPTEVFKVDYAVTPGTHSMVQLERREYNRFPPPADGGESNCFDAETLPNPLISYSNYSIIGCTSECYTRFIDNRCGCTEAVFPDLKTGTPICTTYQRMYCAKIQSSEFGVAGDGDTACGCTLPCKQTEYTPRITSYKYPSEEVLNITGLSADEIEYQKKNYVKVDIYYSKMMYELVEEELLYSPFNMIGNVGGTIGLCFGASLLSLCEFLDLATVTIIRKFNQKKKVGGIWKT